MITVVLMHTRVSHATHWCTARSENTRTNPLRRCPHNLPSLLKLKLAQIQKLIIQIWIICCNIIPASEQIWMKPDYLLTSQKAFLAESVHCRKQPARSLYLIWVWLQADQTAGVCLIPECKLTIAVALLLKPKWSFVWSVRCTDRGVHPMKWEYHPKVSTAHLSRRVITHRLMYLKCLGFCLVFFFIILMKILQLLKAENSVWTRTEHERAPFIC